MPLLNSTHNRNSVLFHDSIKIILPININKSHIQSRKIYFDDNPKEFVNFKMHSHIPHENNQTPNKTIAIMYSAQIAVSCQRF